MEPTFTFKELVWLWQGKAAWHFISLPLDLSAEIKSFVTHKRGFGSIPVKVTIGQTSWKTSIFPSKKGNYDLPLKAAIRKKEKINAGDKVQVSITLQ